MDIPSLLHLCGRHCTWMARPRHAPGRLRLASLPTGMTAHGPGALPATAFVLEEVLAGSEPGNMVPQLPSVLTRWDRSDDRTKEAALTIDRDHRHTESLQPLDPFLVLHEDTVFHPWLGRSLGAPGRIEPR